MRLRRRRSVAIGEAELYDLEANACPTCGSCAGMFTANSMNCLMEALGHAAPAAALRAGVAAAFEAGVMTPDLGGTATTDTFADAVARAAVEALDTAVPSFGAPDPSPR